VSTDALWYSARGTGLVTLLLLTVVVAVGIAVRSGQALPGLPRFAVAAVHRTAGLFAVVLLAVHVTTLLFDPYAQLSLLDVVVPFAGTYRPLWLGLGTVALDLLLAVVVTSLLRHRLGRRGWRAVHWVAYAAWPAALIHGLGTGTDSGQVWMRAVAALCALVVAAAVVWRCSRSFPEFSRARRNSAVPVGLSTAEYSR
jgi:methionine sulfoxide reductase heme-binding subunit